MAINQVQQRSRQDDLPWFSDVTLEANGMTLTVSGIAYVSGTPFALAASITLQSPALGTEQHQLYICEDGTLVLDPGPYLASPLYGIICWLDVPAGTMDLASVTINQLMHVPEVQ